MVLRFFLLCDDVAEDENGSKALLGVVDRVCMSADSFPLEANLHLVIGGLFAQCDVGLVFGVGLRRVDPSSPDRALVEIPAGAQPNFVELPESFRAGPVTYTTPIELQIPSPGFYQLWLDRPDEGGGRTMLGAYSFMVDSGPAVHEMN